MPKFPRLALKTILAKDQIVLTYSIQNGDGLCACGRFLNKADAKFCLGQIDHRNGTVTIAGYCFDCFRMINGVLQMINGRMRTNEPDQRRHEIGG